MRRRDMVARKLHVHIGRISVEAGTSPADTPPDRATLAQAIAARLQAGAAMDSPGPLGISAAIADAVAHRIEAWRPTPHTSGSVDGQP